MLEKDPKTRIRADQCLAHPYFKGMDIASERDLDNIEEESNSSDLSISMFERMRKLNEESSKFDMMRIN